MNSDVLYLTAFKHEELGSLYLSVESYISLFVYRYCDLLLEIHFINTDLALFYSKIACSTKILSGLKYKIFDENDDHPLGFSLPAIVTENGKTVIAGLCGVLRWAIKAHVALYPNHYCKDLLGFRGGCLVACAENSIWTKFCEIQLPEAVKDALIDQPKDYIEIPESLILLEEHLKRPVRTHNILKRKLDIAKEVKQQNNNVNDRSDASGSDANFTLYNQNYVPVLDKSDVLQILQGMTITEKSDDFALNHSYLEGIDLTLADMIVFPCVHYFLTRLPSQALEHLQNVSKWYKKMWSDTFVCRAAQRIGMDNSSESTIPSERNVDIKIKIPAVSQISLYKRPANCHGSSLISTEDRTMLCSFRRELKITETSPCIDPSHTKLKCKHQSPEKIICLLFNSGIYPKYTENYCTKLDWSSLPSMLHPANGDLPETRVERKCQQLESIVTAVLKIAKDNQTIVEFCAGGGHVGLLLAYYLPTCKILLIENKEFSMLRAKQRAAELNLENVFFYQCNLDYFQGSFDIGVSLHACGVATDLVIQQCIWQKASFVCCPCCYGNIQDTHLLSYPLSQRFCCINMSKKDYMLLAHFADRNEMNTPTAERGEVCMGLVDMDRVFYAEEQGYKTDLTILDPVTCSPKHNLLIGISPLQSSK